jgi:competence protein ComEA
MRAPADTAITPPDTGVTVEVIGAGIQTEGTYTLRSGAEIIDLIEAAGGLKPGAITSGISWHQALYDGLTLTIPTKAVFQEARSGTTTLTNRDLIRFRAYGNDTGIAENESSDLISLNEANLAELKSLPGIGKVLAGRIIDYRKEHDGFKNVRELKAVFGIGDVTYQELRAKVTAE